MKHDIQWIDDSVTFGSDEYSAGLRTLNLGDGTNSATLNDKHHLLFK